LNFIKPLTRYASEYIQCASRIATVYRSISPDLPTSHDPPTSYQIAPRLHSKSQSASHWELTRRRVSRQSCPPHFFVRAWPLQASDLLPDRRYARIRKLLSKSQSPGAIIRARLAAPAAAPAVDSRSQLTVERSQQFSTSRTSMRPTRERLFTDMSSRRCFEP
jgi:hypothetical protein